MGEASSQPTAGSSAINLMRGWPNPSLLPIDLIKQAANDALSNPSIATQGLLYGPDPGYEPLRHIIAHWLSSFYHAPLPPPPNPGPISANRICITGGASQNLGCMLSVYTDPAYTRNIWIVAPAYMLSFRVFEDAGFSGKMRAIPEDQEGVDIAYLRRELKKSEDEARKRGSADQPMYKPDRKRAKVYKHVIYCVPTFANPSSRTWNWSHRREMVRLAREYDALLVADDVYDFLQWPVGEDKSLQTVQTAHLPRLVDIDHEIDGGAERAGADGFGNACSNGSFSKIAGPGMRVGWVEGTEKFAYGVSQTGTTASGGAPSQLTSTYITNLLTSGQLQRHIRTVLQPAYASRYRTLKRAIDTHLLPLGFTLPQDQRQIVGGYFVWLALPRDLSATALAKACKDEEGVIVAPGPIFEVPGDDSVGFDEHVRLCFSWEEEGKLGGGVQRMGKVARMLLKEGKGKGEGNGIQEGYVLVQKKKRRGEEVEVDAFK